MSDHIAVEAAQTTGRCCGGTAAVPADRQALGLVAAAHLAEREPGFVVLEADVRVSGGVPG
jgi:hypothetical protein